MSSAAPAKPLFDLKSTAWTLTALRLQSADADAVGLALDERFGDSPGLFDNDPLVIDLSPLREADAIVDFERLLPLLRTHHLMPVAVQGGSPAQTAAAAAAGLAEALDAAPSVRPAVAVAEVEEPASGPLQDARSAPLPQSLVEQVQAAVVVQEVVQEVVKSVPPLVVDKPLRSGQRVYARGGDLVVLAAVNFGAEVIADGHVHVYAPLRGRAIAGARGDTTARIFTTCLDPQLVAIAGIYRTAEHELPAEVAGKPAQVRLDGERIVLEPLADH